MHNASTFFLRGILFLALCAGAMAQTPQYYNYNNVGTSSNSFPFNVTLGKEVQWLALPGEFTQPTPCPTGQSITMLYLFMTTTGARTFTDLTIKLGQTTITTLPTGAWYTGTMQTVYSRASVSLASTALAWMSITLDTPFLYDPAQSLVIEITQCTATGTGMSVRQNTLTDFRRSYSGTTTGCPFLFGGQDANIVNCGVDVVPAGIPGWSSQTSGVATALNSVKAVSQSVIWAAGNGGVVLRTTNGGSAWTSVGGGGIGTQDLYAIDAISATTAFVTGTPSTTSYMFRTTNGGTSWDTVYTQAGGFLNAIKMYDATNGIAMGDPVAAKWTIITTTNGGSTWARIATEPTQVGTEAGSNNGLATLGTTHIWFCSNSSPPKVYRSTNSGATWSSSNLPGTATFTAGLAFINAQNGVTGGNNGNAARTTDGGATWTAVTVGGTGAIYSAAAAGTLNFWETRGTTIQKSVNLGATWAQDFSDATAGIFNHISVAVSGNIVNGWAVTTTGKIYTYFNPVDAHDLGVTTLAKLTSVGDQPVSNAITSTPHPSTVDYSTGGLSEIASTSGDEDQSQGGFAFSFAERTSFSSADTVRFRTIVKNFGTFPESTYQVGWSVDGVNQTPVNNTRPIPAGANDTLTFQWNLGVNGPHTARAWANLASDGNRANDTASLGFTVGVAPGDTLYTFVVSNEIILGVTKMGSANKLVFTSGGQSSAVTTDNKWIVTTMNGTILDATHAQLNPTATGASPGFGFRDLAWDGKWLLTSDDNRIRRVDTTTFTEIATPITFGTAASLHRGLGFERTNKIWKSNFTTEPVIAVDTTGANVRTLGTPPVAPYGIAFDKWTSPNRGYLWYSEPSSSTLPCRLSKIDTTTGAIITSYNYGSFTTGGTSGGLEIINDHPGYPGRVVAILVIQSFPSSRVIMIDLGPDSSASTPTPGWTARTSGVTSFLQSVKQVNANVIWAAGNGATVRRSTDGGVTWTNGNSTPGIITGDIYNIEALDANTAFVTTSPAATFIYRTTNGGTNWTQVFTQAGGFINAIRMVSPTVGIAEGDPVGGTFTIVGTTDGGATWTRVPPANEPVPVGAETGLNNSLSTVGTTHIWFGSSLGPVWRSTNSGASWTRVATTFTGNNLEVHFNNTSNGVTGNNAGLANRSTDGGATWVATTIPGTGGVNGLSGAGADFFASKGIVAYRSTNGGATWASSYGGGIGTLSHLDFYASGGNLYGTTISQTGGIATAFFGVTGVRENTQELPTVFSLAQNYPNPFNPSTTIGYTLPEAARVNLSIYNMLGQRVAELTNEVESAGFYTVVWNGRNQNNAQVATGVYFYRIEATPANGTSPFVRLKKMVLIK